MLRISGLFENGHRRCFSFFGLGFEDGRLPTFWLLLCVYELFRPPLERARSGEPLRPQQQPTLLEGWGGGGWVRLDSGGPFFEQRFGVLG